MSESSWGRKTAGGILWSNASFLATRAVSLITLLVLARLLAPSEFGVLAAIVVYLSLIELWSDLGMNATVVYEQERGVSDRVQTAFTLNLLLAVTLSAAGFLLAPLIAGFFDMQEHTDLFRLGALNPLLRSAGNIHDSLLLRDMSFRRRVIPDLIQTAARAVVSIALAVAGLGAESLVLGMLVGTLFWAIVQWKLSPLRPTFALDFGVVRSMAAYGSGAAALRVIAAINIRLDAIIVGKVLGERALGLYSVAFRVPELLLETVASNISLVAFPALSRKHVTEKEGVAGSARLLLHFQALYALPLATGIAIVGTPMIVVLFGSRWEPAGGVASAVAVMAGVSSLAFPLGDIFKAVGKQRVLALIGITQTPLMIAALVFVAPAGIVAIAWTRVATSSLHLTIVTVFCSREVRTPVRYFAGALGPGFAATVGVGLGAGTVRMLWPDLSLLPLLAETAAGALGGVLFLRALSP
ncbi:MAG: lipopolysaccharide biosynthesis protein, partial [Actinomycetota bacterium]|nr:lipopolysaccharide biosynthesis protein [Actinomycetota bacterium]